MTAYEAIKAGADYIVVGRPIRLAADPVAAADKVVAEIERGGGTGPARHEAGGAPQETTRSRAFIWGATMGVGRHLRRSSATSFRRGQIIH